MKRFAVWGAYLVLAFAIGIGLLKLAMPVRLTLETADGEIAYNESEGGFVLQGREEPYLVDGMDWWILHIPATTINTMFNPTDHTLYDERNYVGERDPIIMTAKEIKVLRYERLFNLLDKAKMCVYAGCLLGPLALVGMFSLLACVRKKIRNRGLTTLSPRTTAWVFSPFGYAIVVVLVFLLTLPPPICELTAGLDPAWSWVENHFAMSPIGNGVSFFFTSGPLGFMMSPYLAKTASVALCVNLVYGTVFAVVLIWLFARHERARMGLWLLPLTLALLPINAEWRWFLVQPVVLVAAATARSRKESAMFAVLGGIALCLGLLLKFTMPIVSAGLVIAATIYMWFLNRRCMLPFIFSYVASALAAGVFAVAMAFPSLDAFTEWTSLSMEIAKGYAHAMTTPPTSFLLALPILFALSSFLVVFPIKTSEIKERMLSFLLVAPFIGFVYKYSMVRFGFDKLLLLGFAACWSMALLAAFGTESIKRNAMRFFAFAAMVGLGSSCVNFVAFGSSPMGLSPSNLVATLGYSKTVSETESKSLANLEHDVALPEEWERIIGTNTVSAYPVEMTLFAKWDFKKDENAPRFLPFPILQGYSCYTETLDEEAAERWTPGAPFSPKYIVADAQTVEQRNVLTDTPCVWDMLVRNYEIAASDENRVLLRKRKLPLPERNLEPLGKRILSAGQWLELPDNEDLFLRVDWGRNVFGELVSLAFRDTQCSLTIEDETGLVRRVRISPDACRYLFPVNRIPTGGGYVYYGDLPRCAQGA